MKLPFYNRFIGGKNITELVYTIHKNNSNNYLPIIDYARENSKNNSDILKHINMLTSISKNSFLQNYKLSYALKTSSYNTIDNVKNIIDILLKCNNTQNIFLDSEDLEQNKVENKIYSTILKDYDTNNIFKTYQMYKKASLDELQNDLLSYNNFGIKLVRGAYHNANDLHFSNINDTHASYDKAVEIIIKEINKNPKRLKLLIATHNQESINKALILKPNKDYIYFAQLMGMGDTQSKFLVSQGYTVYKYTPFGSFSELFPYLLRRLYENKGILKHI